MTETLQEWKPLKKGSPMPEGFVPHHPLARCWECPLYRNDKGENTYVPASKGSNGFGVVGEAPGADEVAKRTPFIGPTGKRLIKLAEDSGTDHLLFPATITNAAACRPRPPEDGKGNNPPPQEAIDACNPRLWDDLEGCHTVVAMGTRAVPAVLGEKVSIGEGRIGPRKRIVSPRGNDVNVVVTWHPAYLFRNPRAEKDVLRDLRKLIEDEKPWTEPEIVICWDAEHALAELAEMAKTNGDLALDIETARSRDYLLAHHYIPANKPDILRCIGLCVDPNRGVVISEVPLRDPRVKAALEALMRQLRVVTYNGGSFDLPVLEFLGFEVPPVGGDAMLATYAEDERPTSILGGLEAASQEELGSPTWKWMQALNGKGKPKVRPLDVLRKQYKLLTQGSTAYDDVADLVTMDEFYAAMDDIKGFAKRWDKDTYKRFKDVITLARKEEGQIDTAREKIEDFYAEHLDGIMTRDEYVAMLETDYGIAYDVAPDGPLCFYCGIDTVNTFRVVPIKEAQVAKDSE